MRELGKFLEKIEKTVLFGEVFLFSCLKTEKNSRLPIDKTPPRWYDIYMYRLYALSVEKINQKVFSQKHRILFTAAVRGGI